MRVTTWLMVLAGCAGPRDDSPGQPSLEVAVEMGPVAVLTEPGAGLLQSHATVAWGEGGQYLVSWAVGASPATQTVAQLFSEDGTALAEPIALGPGAGSSDKPDVEWDGHRYVVGLTAMAPQGGRVFLAPIGADGALQRAPVLLYEGSMITDVVDLALGEGSGTAIWTEYGAPWMTEEDGLIVQRSFDAALQGLGPPQQVDLSSRKTADAAALPEGGWVGVWTRSFPRPGVPGEMIYEVWGRLYRGDGTAWTFRADDLDTAWPSRPAVAVSDDGTLAVSWRDKTEGVGAGKGSGAYARLFDADAQPLGPSLALGEGHDGDRVVIGWAGELAVAAWQETDDTGLPGLLLSAIHAPTRQIVVDRLMLHEPGGDRDERPSLAIREVEDGYQVLVVWETLDTSGQGRGLRARIVTLRP